MSRDLLWREFRRWIAVGLAVIILGACATGGGSAEPATSTADVGAEIEEETAELIPDAVAARAELQMRLLSGSLFPSKEQLQGILRTNEIPGLLQKTYLEIVQVHICQDFGTKELLRAGSSAQSRELQYGQSIDGLDSEEVADVFHHLSMRAITRIDVEMLRSNVARLADTIFRSSDKRCKGELGLWRSLSTGNWERTSKFKSGYFPEAPRTDYEVHHFIQQSEGRRSRFGRTFSLIILPAAESAIWLEVLSYNLRPGTSKIGIEDMLQPISRVHREIVDTWLNAIQMDPSWNSL